MHLVTYLDITKRANNDEVRNSIAYVMELITLEMKTMDIANHIEAHFINSTLIRCQNI